jgi:ribosomal protein L11 methyltransferase
LTAKTTTLTLSGLVLSEAERLAASLEQELDAPLAVSINETDEVHGLWNVIAYFPDSSSAELTKQRLAQTQAFNGACRIETIPETGWVEKSLKELGPVIAGRFFLHGAHDCHRRRPSGISLEIDAGTAFGTGHHATTQGCLLALERLLKHRQPRTILDVGTGTGVLALAAAKALHRRAIASDIDPEAVWVTEHNARINGLRPWIRVFTAAGLRHRAIACAAPYELIFANILARPLMALGPELSQVLAPKGRLILSGLTEEQTRPVFAAYRNRGLVFEACLPIGQWRTLMLAKTKKRPGREGTGRFRRLSGSSCGNA